MSDVDVTPIGAAYGLFWAGSFDWPAPLQATSRVGALLSTTPNGVFVHTAVHTGLVAVSARYWESDPRDFDPAAWEAAEIAVVDDPDGSMCVIPLFGDGEMLEGLTSHPGRYAIRCQARGRVGVTDDTPACTEEYRLDIWPATSAEQPRVLKRE